MVDVFFERKTYRIGGALVVSIPYPIVKTLGLKEGDKFKIWIADEDKIILERKKHEE